MRSVYILLLSGAVLAGSLTVARAETAPRVRHSVRIVIGQRRAAAQQNRTSRRDSATRLASFISGHLAPMLGRTNAHNVKSCADCAVVVQ